MGKIIGKTFPAADLAVLRNATAPPAPVQDNPLAKLSRGELDAFAAEIGIDTTSAKNKQDAIAAIEQHQAQLAAAQSPQESEALPTATEDDPDAKYLPQGG